MNVISNAFNTLWMDSISISAIREGSEAAFEAVYHAFHQKLYAYFLKKTGAEAISKELVQQSFIKLWRFRKNLNEELSLSIQLFRIAKTVAIDLLRKEARNRAVPVDDHFISEIPVAAKEEMLYDKIHLVKNELRHLSPMRRKIMEYRLEGFSNSEIASSMAVSKKTVENQINKAIHDIRKKIDMPLVLIWCLVDCLIR